MAYKVNNNKEIEHYAVDFIVKLAEKLSSLDNDSSLCVQLNEV